MAVFQVESVTIETFYNRFANKWMARVFDSNQCYFKARKLREGSYPFFNNIVAIIDYTGIPDNAPLDEFVPDIRFEKSCAISETIINVCPA